MDLSRRMAKIIIKLARKAMRITKIKTRNQAKVNASIDMDGFRWRKTMTRKIKLNELIFNLEMNVNEKLLRNTFQRRTVTIIRWKKRKGLCVEPVAFFLLFLSLSLFNLWIISENNQIASKKNKQEREREREKESYAYSGTCFQ